MWPYFSGFFEEEYQCVKVGNGLWRSKKLKWFLVSGLLFRVIATMHFFS